METISLIVDIEVARVRAVCRWPAGSTMPLFIDDRPSLPAAIVVTASGVMLTGADALQRAAMEPDRVVMSPMTLLAAGPVAVAERTVDPVDLVGALIGRCADEARVASGTTIAELCLVAPADWGPRRYALLRQAASRAGFAEPVLISAAVAAAVYATHAAGVVVPVDGFLQVCGIDDAGVCATVLHRRGDLDWETHTCIRRGYAPDAVPPPAAGVARPATGDSRNVHHTGSGSDRPSSNGAEQPASGGRDSDRTVAVAVRAVAEALDAADVDPNTVTGLILVSGDPHLSTVKVRLETMVGMPVSVPPRPEQAVVLGCARAFTPAADETRSATWAPIAAPTEMASQNLALTVAGAGSLVLLSQTLSTAYIHRIDTYIDYVLLNHGEFAVACLLALVAAMTAGRGLVLIRVAALAARHAPEQAKLPQQILAAAAGIGITVAVIYALLGALTVQQPTDALLGTAAIATLPIALLGCWIALLLPRLGYLGGRVLRQLTTRMTPIVAVCVGIAAMQVAYTTAWAPNIATILGRTGGAAAAGACAWLLTRRRYPRMIAVPRAAAVGALAAGVSTASAYGYAYVICCELWWLLQTVAITTEAFPRLRTLTWPRRRTDSPVRDPWSSASGGTTPAPVLPPVASPGGASDPHAPAEPVVTAVPSDADQVHDR